MAVPASIVIVGAGQSGAMAAATLRHLGYAGRLTLVGRETHLPYERPPLSKAVLGDAGAEGSAAIHPPGFYAENDIALVRGTEVVALDRGRREVRLSDGTALSYDQCVLATGGHARELPILARGTSKVHYLRTMDDARSMRSCLTSAARVIVIGGGFLGLEVASTALDKHARVTIVESAGRLLPNALPAEFAQWLAARARAAGAALRLGARIAGVRLEADGRTPAGLELEGGETLDADAIVVAIGLQPEVDLARAAGLGIDPRNGGVKVDACCRTIDPNIYAIGDCASQHRPALGRDARLESWQNANEQARVAAAAILGADPPPAPYPWFWTDQFGCNIQMLGMPAPDIAYVCRGSAEPDAEAPRLLWLGHRDGVPVHGLAVNAATDLRQMRVLFERAIRGDVRGFTDPSVPLKSWTKACQQAAMTA